MDEQSTGPRTPDRDPDRDQVLLGVGALAGAATAAAACVLGFLAMLPLVLTMLLVAGDRRVQFGLPEALLLAVFVGASLAAGSWIGGRVLAERRRGVREGAAIVAFALVTAAGTAFSPHAGRYAPWAAGLGAAALAGAALWSRESTWPER